MSSPDHSSTDRSGVSTRSVHAGAAPESHTGSVVAPIFQTSTFEMDVPGQTRAGFDYARTAPPTGPISKRSSARSKAPSTRRP